jgi:hypothetical protein
MTVVLAVFGAKKFAPEPFKVSDPPPLTILQEIPWLKTPIPVTFALKTLLVFNLTLVGLAVTVTPVTVPFPWQAMRLEANNKAMINLCIEPPNDFLFQNTRNQMRQFYAD